MAAFIFYGRVSTNKQELGIPAQLEMCQRYVASVAGEIVAEYTEHASGKIDARPQLAAAIAEAKAKHAKLIVAKVDRLSRRVAFLFDLRDSLAASGVDLVVASMPDVIRDTLTFGVWCSMAQAERELIGERTRAALAAKRASGVALGNSKGVDTSAARAASASVRMAAADAEAQKHCHTATALYRANVSLSEIARTFNAEGKTTPRGSAWTATAIRRLLVRCGTIA